MTDLDISINSKNNVNITLDSKKIISKSINNSLNIFIIKQNTKFIHTYFTLENNISKQNFLNFIYSLKNGSNIIFIFNSELFYKLIHFEFILPIDFVTNLLDSDVNTVIENNQIFISISYKKKNLFVNLNSISGNNINITHRFRQVLSNKCYNYLYYVNNFEKELQNICKTKIKKLEFNLDNIEYLDELIKNLSGKNIDIDISTQEISDILNVENYDLKINENIQKIKLSNDEDINKSMNKIYELTNDQAKIIKKTGLPDYNALLNNNFENTELIFLNNKEDLLQEDDININYLEEILKHEKEEDKENELNTESELLSFKNIINNSKEQIKNISTLTNNLYNNEEEKYTNIKNNITKEYELYKTDILKENIEREIAVNNIINKITIVQNELNILFEEDIANANNDIYTKINTELNNFVFMKDNIIIDYTKNKQKKEYDENKIKNKKEIIQFLEILREKINILFQEKIKIDILNKPIVKSISNNIINFYNKLTDSIDVEYNINYKNKLNRDEKINFYNKKINKQFKNLKRKFKVAENKYLKLINNSSFNITELDKYINININNLLKKYLNSNINSSEINKEIKNKNKKIIKIKKRLKNIKNSSFDIIIDDYKVDYENLNQLIQKTILYYKKICKIKDDQLMNDYELKVKSDKTRLLMINTINSKIVNISNDFTMEIQEDDVTENNIVDNTNKYISNNIISTYHKCIKLKDSIIDEKSFNEYIYKQKEIHLERQKFLEGNRIKRKKILEEEIKQLRIEEKREKDKYNNWYNEKLEEKYKKEELLQKRLIKEKEIMNNKIKLFQKKKIDILNNIKTAIDTTRQNILNKRENELKKIKKNEIEKIESIKKYKKLQDKHKKIFLNKVEDYVKKIRDERKKIMDKKEKNRIKKEEANKILNERIKKHKMIMVDFFKKKREKYNEYKKKQLIKNIEKDRKDEIKRNKIKIELKNIRQDIINKINRNREIKIQERKKLLQKRRDNKKIQFEKIKRVKKLTRECVIKKMEDDKIKKDIQINTYIEKEKIKKILVNYIKELRENKINKLNEYREKIIKRNKKLLEEKTQREKYKKEILKKTKEYYKEIKLKQRKNFEDKIKNAVKSYQEYLLFEENKIKLQKEKEERLAELLQNYYKKRIEIINSIEIKKKLEKKNKLENNILEYITKKNNIEIKFNNNITNIVELENTKVTNTIDFNTILKSFKIREKILREEEEEEYYKSIIKKEENNKKHQKRLNNIKNICNIFSDKLNNELEKIRINKSVKLKELEKIRLIDIERQKYIEKEEEESLRRKNKFMEEYNKNISKIVERRKKYLEKKEKEKREKEALLRAKLLYKKKRKNIISSRISKNRRKKITDYNVQINDVKSYVIW